MTLHPQVYVAGADLGSLNGPFHSTPVILCGRERKRLACC